MTDTEFIEKLKKLDPFFHESEIPFEILYEHFEIVVEEMERLEDIEDNTIQMQACIDGLEKCHQRTEEMLEEFKKYNVKYTDRVMYTGGHLIDLLEYLLEGKDNDKS